MMAAPLGGPLGRKCGCWHQRILKYLGRRPMAGLSAEERQELARKGWWAGLTEDDEQRAAIRRLQRQRRAARVKQASLNGQSN
jgi:hypothetical protein